MVKALRVLSGSLVLLAAPLPAVPLAPYAGDYFSAELNSPYHVAVRDSTLVLSTGTSPGMDWRPVFPDTLSVGNWWCSSHDLEQT
jgi:hypothetical protein